MVARDDHHLQMGHAAAGLLQKAIQLAMGGRRRIGVIENIAGDQQHVDALCVQRPDQPVEEALVFVDPVEIVQGLAKMPVGGVQQPHGGVLPLRKPKSGPTITQPATGRGAPCNTISQACCVGKFVVPDPALVVKSHLTNIKPGQDRVSTLASSCRRLLLQHPSPATPIPASPAAPAWPRHARWRRIERRHHAHFHLHTGGAVR